MIAIEYLTNNYFDKKYDCKLNFYPKICNENIFTENDIPKTGVTQALVNQTLQLINVISYTRFILKNFLFEHKYFI
jgi:hypothetical protein